MQSLGEDNIWHMLLLRYYKQKKACNFKVQLESQY